MSAIDIHRTLSSRAEAKQNDTNPTTLPNGFPVFVNGKIAWVGSHFDGTEYIYCFSAEEMSEIVQALANFKELGVQGTSINKFNFDLPTLGAKLEAFAKEVHTGRGFILLRGLSATMFPGGANDLTMVFMGISSYISDKVGRQDGSGNALVHIIADKKESAHNRHGTDAISFHTEESADAVAWLTRSAAAMGGHCVISSAATIYNVLATTRPDLVRVLSAGNWPFSLPRYLNRPVIFNEGGRVLFNFGRPSLVGSASHPRKQHLPALSAKQLEALEAIETIARATELSFETQAGDIHFINNMQVLHRRDTFTDGQGQDEQRHLVRMRLSDSKYGTDIPCLRREWEDAFNEEADFSYHLDPMPSGYFPLRKYPN